MILCIIAFGLNLLRTVRTRSNMIEFQPQKERRRQESDVQSHAYENMDICRVWHSLESTLLRGECDDQLLK